jgi:urease beta subunit
MAISYFQKPILGQTYLGSSSISGTSYSVSNKDANKILIFENNDSEEDITVTISNNSSMPIPVGSSIQFIQNGSSPVTLSAASGVEINTTTGLKTRSQYSSINLIKIGTNKWMVPTRSRPPYVFVQDSEPVGAEAGDLWFW